MTPTTDPHKRLPWARIGSVVAWVVVGLIAALSGITIGSGLDYPDLARVYKAAADLQALAEALELYKADYGHYLSAEEGLDTLIINPDLHRKDAKPATNFGYLMRLPKDPWGNRYQYLSPGRHNPLTFDLWTQVANSQAGSTGPDIDMGNWPGGIEQAKKQAGKRVEIYDAVARAILCLIVAIVLGLLLYLLSVSIEARLTRNIRAAAGGFNLRAYLWMIGIVTLAPSTLMLIASLIA